MSPLNIRPSMDPRWPLRHRSVPIGWQVATIVIGRRDGTEAVWDPETGAVTGGGFDFVWLGTARVQPNKDWRARRKDGENSPMAQHATRVQFPMGSPPALIDDFIGVLESPYDESLIRYVLHVRNSIESSNTWGRSLLADIDVTEDSASWDSLRDLALANGWEGVS